MTLAEPLLLLLWRVVGPVALALAALGLAYLYGRQAGATVERTKAIVAAAQAAERQAELIAQARQVAQRQGESAMRVFLMQNQAANAYTATVRERISHAPPLVAAVRCVDAPRPALALAAAAGPAGGGLADGAASAPAAGGLAASSVAFHEGPAPAAPGWADAPLAAGNPVLTLGAVSLWNSALAGADVPAAACRADEPASAACAAAAGTTLAAAWDNHAANAASCAATRAQLTTIINLLCLRPGQEGCGQ